MTVGGYYYDQLAYFGGHELLNRHGQGNQRRGRAQARHLLQVSDPIPSKSKVGITLTAYIADGTS